MCVRSHFVQFGAFQAFEARCIEGVRGCLFETLRVFQVSFKDVSCKFQGCFQQVSRKFKGYFKEVSRVFQESFRSLPRVFEGA